MAAGSRAHFWTCAVSALNKQRLSTLRECDMGLPVILQTGVMVEKIYGAPQDIEGVVIGDDTIALVQTRPQV